MGFWSEKVLPRIVDKGMRNEFMAEHRVRAAPLARGRVLEIGLGSGLNIPHYGPDVTHLFGLEPSRKLLELAAEPVDEAPFPVELLEASASSIPLEDASVDSVVSSWTLCSVPEAETAMQEIRRVLKPSGSFIFIEHGRAPDAGVSRWQDRLVPISRPLLGCSLNRAIDELIEAAGFRFTSLEKSYVDGPKLISYHYIGQAQPLQ